MPSLPVSSPSTTPSLRPTPAPFRATAASAPTGGGSQMTGDSLQLGAGAPASVNPAPVTPSADVSAAFTTLWHDLVAVVERLLHAFTPATPSPAIPATPPIASPPAAPVAPSAPTPPPAASLSQAIAQLQPNQPLSLGAGTFSFNNFGSDLGSPLVHVSDESLQQGLDLAPAVTGIAGAGIDKTVLQMTPRTSTHAGDIPTQTPDTNQYSLLRVEGSPNLHDFTLKGTDQGHLYNGLRVNEATNARITNVKVTGIPGDDYVPPGETFGINDYRGTNNVYQNIEVDGQGVGASGFGADDGHNITIQNGYFHDNAHSCGATFWQTQDVTLTDCKAANNHAGFNFERVSGTVNIVRPQITTCKDADISIASDQGSATYTITDPVLAPGQTLRIMVPVDYNGVPNTQKKSDIHVIAHGVDVTDQVVTWCT